MSVCSTSSLNLGAFVASLLIRVHPAAPTSTASPPSKKPLFRAPSPDSGDDDDDDDVAKELTSQIAKLKVAEKVAATAEGTSASAISSTSTAAASTSKKTAQDNRPDASRSPVTASNQSGAPVKAEQPVAQVPPTIQEPEETGPTQDDIAKAAYDPPDDRKLMLSEECDINLFDKATGMFMLQEAGVVASLWLVKGETFTCGLTQDLTSPSVTSTSLTTVCYFLAYTPGWLSVAGKDGFIWISTPVDGQLPLHFEEAHLSVILSFNNEKTGQNFTWLLRYNERETYLKMNEAFTQGIFEASNGFGTWSKLKVSRSSSDVRSERGS